MNTALLTPEDDDNVVPLLKPQIAFVAVTPEIARRWLQHNRSNRRLDRAAVRKYAETMKSGNWSLDSNAICFDPEGNLLQGQHRLSAVVLADVTITFSVQRNVPPEAMKFMDRGRARTVGQNLSFVGEKDASLLAAIARLTISLGEGRLYNDIRDDEIYAYVDADQIVRRSATAARSTIGHLDTTPTAAGTAHRIIAGANSVELADSYIYALRTRANEPEGSPVLAVDSRLRRGGRRTAPAHVVLLIKAWNYWAAGERVRTLEMPAANARLPKVARWTRETK